MNALEMASLEIYQLEAIERKFLLKLFEVDGHSAHISKIKPHRRISLAKCERICQSLSEKGFVEYESEIFRFTLSAPGRMLLTLTTTSLPVTPDELKLLRRCKGSMTTAKLGSCVPVEGRSQLISDLVKRKLLKVTKKAIQGVRLTQQGKALLNIYCPEEAGSKSV